MKKNIVEKTVEAPALALDRGIEGGQKIDINMTMTAPGCGMGNVLKADIERKLSQLPAVKAVNANVVFDPPWHPSRMSEAAKLQLGLDLDTGSSFPVYR